MNIPQYVEMFAKEVVDGELLLELNDAILSTELDMKSPLHRKRMMKLIVGDHSAEGYFKGEGPYGTAHWINVNVIILIAISVLC